MKKILYLKKAFTLVEIMIVVVIIGILASMAVPSFQKVRTTAQEKAILNNLRQYASAAQQYMLDQGKTQASSGDLIGTTKYIPNIRTVNGEVYNLTINQTDTQVTITYGGSASNVVTYSF